jgi:hypothetical protein
VRLSCECAFYQRERTVASLNNNMKMVYFLVVAWLVQIFRMKNEFEQANQSPFQVSLRLDVTTRRLNLRQCKTLALGSNTRHFTAAVVWFLRQERYVLKQKKDGIEIDETGGKGLRDPYNKITHLSLVESTIGTLMPPSSEIHTGCRWNFVRDYSGRYSFVSPFELLLTSHDSNVE